MAKCKNCGADEEVHDTYDGSHCENFEPEEVEEE